MEFCGRCGHELGRGIERGRFCPKCGHEAPGNARYPLYADGTAAVTRPRPASVSQMPDETVVAAVPVRETARVRSSAPTATAVAEAPADVTRRRVPVVGDAQVVAQRSPESWKITVAVTIAAMAVVVILGFLLLLH